MLPEMYIMPPDHACATDHSMDRVKNPPKENWCAPCTMLKSSLAPKAVVYSNEFSLNWPATQGKCAGHRKGEIVRLVGVGVDADVLRTKHIGSRNDRRNPVAVEVEGVHSVALIR